MAPDGRTVGSPQGGSNDEDTRSEIPSDSCARIFLSLLATGEGFKYSRLHDHHTCQHDYDQEPKLESGQLHHHSAKWLHRNHNRRLHPRSECTGNHVPAILRTIWARNGSPDRYRAEPGNFPIDDRNLRRAHAGVSAIPAACISSRWVCSVDVRLTPLHPGERQDA